MKEGYLDSTGQTCFIKPTNYDQKKHKKFQKQIGRIENIAYDPEEDCFTCT
ncbi:hypothetical protein [Pseudoflavonifractor sp. An184]|uniref:hypothetical protein n=1 Tax=Pseudoflavonifractor sp. An184 TaxID=1965576 RepID=UPI0013A64AE6|nr:hypothetical protein [Pseudoflavonifractor sp. An184]